MNRKQYLILCRVRSEARRAERRYRRLTRINEDPDKQYDWDAMKVAEGYARAKSGTVSTLEAFIAAGKRRK